MEVARSKSCANITKATVHTKPAIRRYVIIGIFLIGYSFVLPWVWNTMGAPLERAKEEARLLDTEKSIEELDEFEEVEISFGGKSSVVEASIDNVTLDGNETDVEISNSTTDDSRARPLPSSFLSDAGAMFSMFILVLCHSLFYLLCHWLVWFDVKAFYEPSKIIGPGKYLHIVPNAHRGKAAVCLIKKSQTTDSLEFTFQRQKFILVGPNKGGFAESGEEIQLMRDNEQELNSSEIEIKRKEALIVSEKVGFIAPLTPKINQTINFYLSARGFRNEIEVQKAAVRFGSNNLRSEPVSLISILIKQLLSPLSIFQLFSASLWLLDQYWQQSIFSVIMIVMMEFTTSFQRHRTTKMLRNLAPKPFAVVTFRCGQWGVVASDKLLPGDLISLASNKDKSDVVVPCDCLLLHGSAVVNEATLTGESVPQMKDSISQGTNLTDKLDVNGRDRVHVLFSGTSLISITPGDEQWEISKKLKSPNSGCMAYVLRTGFGSSQGELMQMIEFSTETVSDSKETGLALLILLCFALMSSAYVFKVGMEKGKQTTHEILLRCVMIITSVVPQHLPMQMAAAVNYALIALSKNSILCTEPFRLPSAGKVTHCLFDKTGTLTSDELVPVGIVNEKDVLRTEEQSAVKMLVPVHKASQETAMVLAACHSLIALPSKEDKGDKAAIQQLLGDPIEVAAVKGVQWAYFPDKEVAKPGLDTKIIDKLKEAVLKKIAELQKAGKPFADEQNQLKDLEDMTESAKKITKESKISQIKILVRQHFSSQLQRMSVVTKVSFKDGSTKLACLVKGSPEAIKTLLKAESVPKNYDKIYREMAEKGMRVLALGYKFIDPSDSNFQMSRLSHVKREQVEQDINFAGFISFECKIRGDTKAVIQSLNRSDHLVSMVTGDALLTALHVARCCVICTRDKALLLQETDGGSLEWVTATGQPEDAEKIPFNTELEGCGLKKLAETYDLLLTENVLLKAADVSNHRIWSEVDFIKVFARMSPPGKAEVIRHIQDKGKDSNGVSQKLVFMCGDGGNDVGALKQADVGLALLSGFGSSNTDEVIVESKSEDGDETVLNELDNILKIKSRKANREKAKEIAAVRKKIMGKQKAYLEIEMQRRVQNGESNSISTNFQAVKIITKQLQGEVRAEVAKINQKYNLHKKKHNAGSDNSSIYERVMAAVDEQKNNSSADSDALAGIDDGSVPIVRPGDASVAAPFTSKVPSIRSVVHLIRQGRCTLLSALQQQQTMMLECTISAYTFAALSLEGARQSERQLLASSWLILTAVGSFSYAAPLESMHPVRPIKSLFHPAIFGSIMLQAAIHLFCISYGVNLAKDAMGEDKLNEVIDFNYNAAKGLDQKLEELEDEYNPIESFMLMWQHPFKPNLLNTVVFLVQTSQTMAVFFVNYKGRPWMNGLLENHALFLSLFIAIGAVAVCAWEMIPMLNDLLQLEPFPTELFKWQVMFLVLMSIFGTFVADRLVTAIFAPEIFKAMLDSAKRTSWKDLKPLFSSLVKGVVGFGLLATGNPIFWIGGFYIYKKRQAYLEKKEEERILKLEEQQLLKNKKKSDSKKN